MVLHCALGHDQFGGDLGVGEPTRDALGHQPLRTGQDNQRIR